MTWSNRLSAPDDARPSCTSESFWTNPSGSQEPRHTSPATSRDRVRYIYLLLIRSRSALGIPLQRKMKQEHGSRSGNHRTTWAHPAHSRAYNVYNLWVPKHEVGLYCIKLGKERGDLPKTPGRREIDQKPWLVVSLLKIDTQVDLSPAMSSKTLQDLQAPHTSAVIRNHLLSSKMVKHPLAPFERVIGEGLEGPSTF